MPDTPDTARVETILAFDYGLRRIGVAVGQSVTASASPLGVVSNGPAGPDQNSIAAFVNEWQPARLVVGMPAHADGSPSDMQNHVRRFIQTLAHYELPIDTVDERYTSIEAEAALKSARAAGTRGRITKASIDSAAAVIIAERYLATRNA
jgi:putative Holliday junction resolvase